MDAGLARILGDLPELRELEDKPHRNRRKVIVATLAAVMVAYFVFLALARPGIDAATTPITTVPPVPPPQVEQFGAMQAVRDPGPAQLPAPVPPPVSNESGSVAKTPPALKGADTLQSVKAGGPVTGTNVLVPSAATGTATNRTALSAAEKAAVARGLKELKNTAAINAPRLPARPRSALTEEEKAAVERGLRELEKTAGQAKQ